MMFCTSYLSSYSGMRRINDITLKLFGYYIRIVHPTFKEPFSAFVQETNITSFYPPGEEYSIGIFNKFKVPVF